MTQDSTRRTCEHCDRPLRFTLCRRRCCTGYPAHLNAYCKPCHWWNYLRVEAE